MNIGKKLRKVRELKNISPADIAEKMGIDVAAYNELEENGDELTFKKLKLIVAIMNVTLQDVINIPEQLSVHSVTTSHFGFNYYADRPKPAVENEIAGYKLALENSQKEVEYLRKINESLVKKSGTKRK